MRPPRSGHYVVVAALLGGLLVTFGCTAAGDQPQTLPPVSPQPTEVSSTPAPPPSPSKSPRAQRHEEIERFVVSYFAAIEKSIGQGKTDDFEKATLPQCPCRDILNTVQTAYSQGKTVDGYHIKLKGVMVGTVTARTANATVKHQQNAYTIVGADGQVERSVKQQSFIEDLFLEKVAGGWRVGRVVSVS